MKFRSTGDTGDESLVYVHFEFNTPSTHECYMYFTRDGKADSVEEIAYGTWQILEGHDFESLLDFYKVKPDEVWAMAKENERG